MNNLNQGATGPVTRFFKPDTGAAPAISTPPIATAPRWAADFASGPPQRASDLATLRRSEEFTLLSVRAPAADVADGPALESLTETAYRTLLSTLRSGPHPHPVRVWNFVPGILHPDGEGLNRYMRFNAGRHRAYSACLGGENAFDQSLPAASAVGYDGSDMLIHALAAATPGVQIANPRQCAPHRYSRKFGPLPPCFARATRVHCADGQSFLLIGGTASIRGEESQHLSELENQLAETRTNLISLLGAATGQSPAPRLLNCLDQLRVYYPNARHLPEIRQSVESWFPNPDRIEWGQADLCRAELLVEIEGRANLILPESIQPA